MPVGLEAVTKGAMDLPRRQKLILAALLLESAESQTKTDIEAAWDTEIRARIRAIDEGRVTGIPYEEVMRAADELLRS